MPRHLFLSGEKHIGKSTVLEKLLAGEKGVIGGFRTVCIDDVFPGKRSVHLLSGATGGEPDTGNCLFITRCGQDATAQFDRLGVAALYGDCDVIVMDELGPHEEKAQKFCRRVMELLEGETPILGVLQQADSAFLKAVGSHPNVQVVRVTEENRDALAEELKRKKK